ncbi:uncharacterized protein LOC117219920 [Megalopta genalis]|uniref:uncharacterized protein LOC117219920 n=1 Tax=Megalopta genalis TaxID=115081 RepID=UPI003FCFB2FD
MATDKVITEEVTASISSNESKEQISKNDDNANVLPLKEVEMKSYRSKDKESSSEESSEESSSEDEPSIKTEPPTPKNNNNDKNIQHMGIRKKRGIKSECENLPPVEDIKISMPEVLCDPVGKVAWMVDQLVVVQPKLEKPALDLDTILFVDKGKRALGKIFDVFGTVNAPYYCVRFNSAEHIQQANIKVGMIVYYCPNTAHTSLIPLFQLLKIKGVDATPSETPQFSDDEKEMAYYGIKNPMQSIELPDTDANSDEATELPADEENQPSSEKIEQKEQSSKMDAKDL